MSDARRRVVAITASVLVHGGMLLSGLSFIPEPLDIDVDLDIDMVEVDLIDPDTIQGTDVNAKPDPEPDAPEPEPAPPEETPESEPPKEEPPEEPPKEETVIEEGPKRDLGKRRSKVGKLGPPSANYHVLLSTRNIRKLPFGQSAMDMISPLPDFQYLVDKGGFDPLRDFDHILIASSNLRSVTQTFLAVDYRVSRDTVKTKIETAVRKSKQTIAWEDHDGVLTGNPMPANGAPDNDPRHFVLLENKVAVLVRPEFLPAILREEVGEEKTAANFVAELTKLRRYARRIPTAGVQFVAHDLHAALKRKKGKYFELPNDVEFTMEARKNPEFFVRFKFASVSAAEAFVTWWNTGFREYINGNITTKIMLGGVVDDIEVVQERRSVTVWGEFGRTQIELILTTMASVVEKEQAKIRERAEKRRKAEEKKRAASPAGSP